MVKETSTGLGSGDRRASGGFGREGVVVAVDGVDGVVVADGGVEAPGGRAVGWVDGAEGVAKGEGRKEGSRVDCGTRLLVLDPWWKRRLGWWRLLGLGAPHR